MVPHIEILSFIENKYPAEPNTH